MSSEPMVSAEENESGQVPSEMTDVRPKKAVTWSGHVNVTGRDHVDVTWSGHVNVTGRYHVDITWISRGDIRGR